MGLCGPARIYRDDRPAFSYFPSGSRMNAKTVHCEECVEDIPNSEVYWEDDRIYCGRCGSEIELPVENADLLDTINEGSAKPLYSYEDEEYDGDRDEKEEVEEERD